MTGISENLSSILATLPHTWVAPMEPARYPLFTVPSIHVTQTLSTPALEFYPFSPSFWIGMLLIFLMIASLTALIGAITFRYIVRNDMQFSSTSYMVGYGLILPFWLCFPCVVTYQFGVKNKIYRFMMTVISPAISIFRTTAAMHGFSPEHVTHSMSDFVFYYACPVLSQYDPKTQQYTKTRMATVLKNLLKFLYLLFLTGFLISIYNHYPQIFPVMSKPSSHLEESRYWYLWSGIFKLSQQWENICYAALFQYYLTTFAEGLLLIQTILTGYEPVPNAMNNPVFRSTSPSDFWGNRWNAVIHDVLKRGVYLPVRRYYSTNVALMACFFASGIYHEWLCLSTFSSWDFEYTAAAEVEDRTNAEMNTTSTNGTCRLVDREGEFEMIHCYKPVYGAAMGFFLWQATLIAVEFSYGKYWKKHIVLPAIPAALATVITIMLGACVAHWFAEPYLHSNFFLDGEHAFNVWKVVQ